ncbi:MAG: hypothetical protein KJ601_00490 [Nanoarchaeota archaeon]|nr:hypothetical protein [Nanoarchaeota archaeon]MBU1704551.1 hypothetical protein [Nanoarchaeota archaeon]
MIPRIEDIIDDLDDEFHESEILIAPNQGHEQAAYVKHRKRGDVVVGFYQEDDAIMVNVRYRTSGTGNDYMVPVDEALPGFFRRAEFAGRRLDTRTVEGGMLETQYAINIEGPTTKLRMTNVLRDFVRYVIDYAEVHADMFSRTSWM